MEQREKHGFDDTETWNLDGTLVKFLLPRLKRYRTVCPSYPTTMTLKKWQKILDDMIEGFDLLVKEKCGDTTVVPFFPNEKEEQKIKAAWKLLGKYGPALWW